ncbi:MAG: hypothetical protein AB7N65_06040, partial [Vicinamibacterales bacterium]
LVPALAVAVALSPTVYAAGQASSAAPVKAAGKATKSKKPIPRTPDGKPDLQGVWDFAQLTPFERPDEFGNKSPDDVNVEEYAQERAAQSNKDRRDGSAAQDVERAYNDFWWDFGTRVAKQTSLIVDPPNGRMPPLTPAAMERIKNRVNKYDNPEERPLAERCILGFNSGPPMVPSAYNNNVQIVQTKDSVLIFNEMVHSARIVDMTGKPRPPAHMKYLTGYSTGRWEGDTLVVETTNFEKGGLFRMSTPNMKLTERFSREDGDVLRYEFTVTDPEVWTAPITASIPMVASSEQMFEYACHEGNTGMEGVMRGARFQDKQGK